MKHIFSVTQINSYIHRIFESDYALKKIYLKGEVSNCKYHSSGHIYFTLKDAQSTLSCIMFSSDRFRGLTFLMEDGQQVIVCGNISVYEKSGTYQMYARQIELSGAGERYLQYEQLKQQLAREGYFDFEKKKPLPAYPERIGIVTALTGAAVEDIKSIAKRRNPFVQLYLYPAKVQGEGAASEIVRGIQYFDQQKEKVDIIIIGRGGGSIEDLWAFNEREVADAIYNAKTPIISGTGHEIDMTIADYCADVRAATPSAACELAIPDISFLAAQIDHYTESLQQNIEQKWNAMQQKLTSMERALEAQRPDKKLLAQRVIYERLRSQLLVAVKEKLTDRQKDFSRYTERLSALAPTARLRGGYVFARQQDGTPLSSVSQVKEKTAFTLVFADGETEVVPVSKRTYGQQLSGREKE